MNYQRYGDEWSKEVARNTKDVIINMLANVAKERDAKQKELADLKAERDAWKEYAIHQQECGDCAFHSGYCPEGARLQKVAQKAGTK